MQKTGTLFPTDFNVTQEAELLNKNLISVLSVIYHQGQNTFKILTILESCIVFNLSFKNYPWWGNF